MLQTFLNHQHLHSLPTRRSSDLEAHLSAIIGGSQVMPFELRYRRSGQNRPCSTIGPPEEERRSICPIVAQLEQETALLPNHGRSPVCVVCLKKDPCSNRNAGRGVEIRRVRNCDIVRPIQLSCPTNPPRDIRGTK